MRVLVTGANGFIGLPLCRHLAERGHQVVAAARREVPGFATARIADLGPDTDWRDALAGIDAVVHLAARAHIMRDRDPDPPAAFRRANRDGTVRLARQARDCGVGHFLFVSSIKVNGEATAPGRPFTASDAPDPGDAYGCSKAEAEAALALLEGLPTLTILRPPLVHGPGVKGNLALLLKVLAAGVPLPLGGIDNRRSLVGIDNLTSALTHLVEQRAAGTFLVRDGDDVSTPDLLRMIAAGLGTTARLFSLPPPLFAPLGRIGAIARLTGSLTVDDRPLRSTGWTPTLSLESGLARMAAAWRNAR